MDFNLIVSTGRQFEMQAKTELWFNLLSIGDENPIIFSSDISGLVLANTNKDPKELISYFNSILAQHDKHHSQFIHKIYPVDRVVETDLELIKAATLELTQTHHYCQPQSKFRISIRKRKTNLETKDIIACIADPLPFSVDLKNYDWMIQIEILGNYTGISILKDNDIFSPLKTQI